MIKVLAWFLSPLYGCRSGITSLTPGEIQYYTMRRKKNQAYEPKIMSFKIMVSNSAMIYTPSTYNPTWVNQFAQAVNWHRTGPMALQCYRVHLPPDYPLLSGHTLQGLFLSSTLLHPGSAMVCHFHGPSPFSKVSSQSSSHQGLTENKWNHNSK